MILIVENGRLGNQLFQYCGLKISFPQERLVLIGFSQFEQAIEKKDLNQTLVLSLRDQNLLRGCLLHFLRLLCRIRAVTQLVESNTPEKYSFRLRRGLLPWPRIILNANFQHASLTKRIAPHALSLKKALLDRGLEALKLLSVNFPGNIPVFVHIRRGDYTAWPSVSEPAVLPLEWYLEIMEDFRAKAESPVFIVLTDDKPYARDVFKGATDVTISASDELVDLATMANCAHGIISASSFSWWGAYFARQAAINSANIHIPVFKGPSPWMRQTASHIPPTPIVSWIDYVPRP